jgi:hypothetical protein
MFAQGQLLGMQSDLLNRLKTEINAWDKVAEKHPYSVYRRNDYPAYVAKHQRDKFTTNFGNGLPYRVYDRNQRAKMQTEAASTMEQPFPLGYTGHVGNTTQGTYGLGQTYGRKVRDAINDVPDQVDKWVSTQELAFRHPNDEVAAAYDRAARGVSRRRATDPDSIWMSTSQAGYQPPGPESYQTPAWTERMTSNIGQMDTYGHFQESPIHRPPDRPATAAPKMQATSPLPPTNSGSRQSSRSVTLDSVDMKARKSLPPAGCATRPDGWVAWKRR